jgi:hypothetical protein
LWRSGTCVRAVQPWKGWILVSNLRASARGWRWRESNPRPEAPTMNIYRFIRPMFSRRPDWVAAIRRSSKPAFIVPTRRRAFAWVIPDLRQVYRSLGAALPETRRRVKQRERNLRWQLKVLPLLGVEALHLQLMTEPTSVETVAPP